MTEEEEPTLRGNMVKKVGGGTPHSASHNKAKAAEHTSKATKSRSEEPASIATKARVAATIANKIFSSTQNKTGHLDPTRFTKKT